MAKSPSTANWLTIDPASLSIPQQKQYARYKAAYAEMKAEREAFEADVRAAANLPAGQRLAIGYNFGKLSFAVVADDAKPAPAKGSLSLSDFLRTQATLGKRA